MQKPEKGTANVPCAFLTFFITSYNTQWKKRESRQGSAFEALIGWGKARSAQSLHRPLPLVDGSRKIIVATGI
jgi:hypothetical protein